MHTKSASPSALKVITSRAHQHHHANNTVSPRSPTSPRLQHIQQEHAHAHTHTDARGEKTKDEPTRSRRASYTVNGVMVLTDDGFLAPLGGTKTSLTGTTEPLNLPPPPPSPSSTSSSMHALPLPVSQPSLSSSPPTAPAFTKVLDDGFDGGRSGGGGRKARPMSIMSTRPVSIITSNVPRGRNGASPSTIRVFGPPAKELAAAGGSSPPKETLQTGIYDNNNIVGGAGFGALSSSSPPKESPLPPLPPRDLHFSNNTTTTYNTTNNNGSEQEEPLPKLPPRSAPRPISTAWKSGGVSSILERFGEDDSDSEEEEEHQQPTETPKQKETETEKPMPPIPPPRRDRESDPPTSTSTSNPNPALRKRADSNATSDIGSANASGA
ncbi:hypothetical protein HK102_010063, partial [Quaeritorhiza haematococci]